MIRFQMITQNSEYTLRWPPLGAVTDRVTWFTEWPHANHYTDGSFLTATGNRDGELSEKTHTLKPCNGLY